MAWTSAQTEAIQSRGQTLLVSAAAGSGKTAVLVERIIRLVVQEGVPVRELLIVTFTRAAAAQMKEKIHSALYQALRERPDPEGYLRQQLRDLPSASISTLHSFCQNLLKRYFTSAQIDPGFHIATQTVSTLLKREAIQQTLEEYYSQEPADTDFLQLSDAYGGRFDEELEALVLRVHSFIMSQPAPFDWLQTHAQDFFCPLDIQKNAWFEVIREDAAQKLSHARKNAKTACALCMQSGGPSLYEPVLKREQRAVEDLEKLLEADFEAFCSQLSQFSFERLPPLRGAAKEVADPFLTEQVKALRESIKKQAIVPLKERMGGKSLALWQEQIAKIAPAMEALRKVVERFDWLYQEKKRSRNVVDFNDLEQRALQVLQIPQNAAEIQALYQYIFFDEYQDANLVQETLIQAICRPDNVFLVGDVKQSIYRFRLSDPTLFLNKYQAYATEPGQGVTRRIDLAHNFRSRQEILAFSNDLFSSLMSPQLGEMHYDESVYLRPGVEFPENPQAVEMCLLYPAQYEDSEDEEVGGIQAEAYFTARRIQELIGQPYFNPRSGAYEPIGYQHIVVLLRSAQTAAPVYAQAFEDSGIPFFADLNEAYYQIQEVSLLLNLLRIIDHFDQDEPLLSVMYSVIGGFSADELAQYRIAYKSGSFAQAVRQKAAQTDPLGQKSARFIHTIEQFSFLEKSMPLDEFIWEVLSQTGYYSYVGAMLRGEERQQNLRMLMDRAAEFEQNTARGLFSFLRYVQVLLVNRADSLEPKALLETQQVVRVMTIHKSKGLEFPVVFVGGLQRRFNLKDQTRSILLHAQLGLGPDFVDLALGTQEDSLPKAALKIKSRQETLSEEMRILYVALTRAIDRLILTGFSKDLKKSLQEARLQRSPESLQSATCYLEWILYFLADHPAAAQLDGSGNALPVSQQKSASQFWLRAEPSVKQPAQEKEVLACALDLKTILEKGDYPVDPFITASIKERFDWRYPFAEDTKRPPKTTATARVLAASQGLQMSPLAVLDFEMPAFYRQGSKMDAASRGTLVHLVMQNIDLANHALTLPEQLERMVQEEKITAEQRAAVPEEKITAFLNSSLGRRMQAAAEIKREQAFLYKDGLQIIHGVIDCYFQENDGNLVLIDYKTDHGASQDPWKVAQYYRPQMEIYRQALEAATLKRVTECYIYLFAADQAVRLETRETDQQERPL